MIAQTEAIREGPVRVLLVEDDAATHDIVRKLLVRRGFEVLSAMTLAGGLQLLEHQPDCVVLDLMLPDGDGETLLRTVRSAALPIRVVVSSAVCDTARLQEVRALAPDAMLTKPISMVQLFESLGPTSRS